MRAWKTLAPGRAHPTSIDTLVKELSPGARVVVQGALTTLCAAIEKHFPENIFVDLDRLSVSLASTLREGGAEAAREQAERLVSLHSLFGGQTAIRFRYVHDFLYGFDWARWVAREPRGRRTVGPFDREFLVYSEERARELLALIAQDDPKYGTLEPREHRNPFPFRRDPEAERAILSALAADGAIPVAAWSVEPLAVWDRPYALMREAKAQSLGLSG
jgi:hypothetical protein